MSFSFVVFLMIVSIVMGLVSMSTNEDLRRHRIDGVPVTRIAKALPDTLLFTALVIAHITGRMV